MRRYHTHTHIHPWMHALTHAHATMYSFDTKTEPVDILVFPKYNVASPQALRLGSKTRKAWTVGEVVNLMSVDAQRLVDLMPYLHMLWSAPLQIALALGFLWLAMGPSIFAGFVVMLLLVPFNIAVAGLLERFQVRTHTRTCTLG